MKKIASLIVALIAALSLTAAFAEAPAEEAAVRDIQALVDEATADLLGANYEVIGLAASAPLTEDIVIEGYLCRVTTVGPQPAPRFAILFVAVNGDEAQMLGANYIPFTDEDGNPEMPDAGQLSASLLEPIADLPDGTAGAGLNRAVRVMYVTLTAAMYRFDLFDAEALLPAFEEAAAALTEEQRTAFAENAPAIIAEALRLCDPAEALGGEYADAGVAEVMEALRADETVAASLAALAGMMAE